MNHRDVFWQLAGYDELWRQLEASDLSPWVQPLQQQLLDFLFALNDGNFPRFVEVVSAMPEVVDSGWRISDGWVELISAMPLSDELQGQIDQALRALMPWRKGPFRFFQQAVDSEWRCHLKWDRIAASLPHLGYQRILDVGCGNGYFGWRLLEAGAEHVLGVDPSWLSVLQHCAVNRYARSDRHHLLPFTFEQLMATGITQFDRVLSLGVLSHRRSPLDHLQLCRDSLRPGGQLVLENLVVDGQAGYALIPPGRYARMNNVWFIPSVDTLIQWCEKMGFEDVKCVDVTVTTECEQRETPWKPGSSLRDGLDLARPGFTIEGLPAPQRAVVLARKPSSGRLPRYDMTSPSL